jgi:cytochrome oxidase Cu insertion factor (SCO1/SenC/PrrC family)
MRPVSVSPVVSMLSTTGGPSRRTVLSGGVGVLLAALAGCTSGGDATTSATGGATATPGERTTATPGAVDDWRAVELTDVTTDESFSIERFDGRPVLVEFFAVWCPVCTNQQEEVGVLTDRMDDVVAVSLNVDSNEDAEQVREHAGEHGFDWYYAVAPPSMTRALVEEFGPIVTNAPAAPVVTVCPGGSVSLVEGRGVKSADALAAAFDRC